MIDATPLKPIYPHQMSLRLDDEEWAWLETKVEDGRSRSSVIRQLIRRGMKAEAK